MVSFALLSNVTKGFEVVYYELEKKASDVITLRSLPNLLLRATKTENKIFMYHLAGLPLTAFLGKSDTAAKLSAENRGKECHRFWLRYTVNLISNDRTSASKKINRMALIRTLTISNVAFERKKNSTVFGRPLKGFDMTDLLNNQQSQKPGIHMNVLKGVNRKEKAGNFGKSQPSWFHQADFTIEKSYKH